MPDFKLAIFASGSGTNAEAIMRYFQKHPKIRAGLILTNNPNAGVLERASRFGIPTKVFTSRQLRESSDVLNWLKESGVTHVILAGFLLLVPKSVLDAFSHKIVNIHPALLPKYGGKGMYGNKVHEAVIAASELETGITVHLVNEKFDDGEILFQASCPIDSQDHAESIANKVHQLEHAHYPRIIEKFVLGELKSN